MKHFLGRLWLWLIFIFLYAPIVILIIYSFNEAKYSLQWQGFSLHWYAVLFKDSNLWQALLHSLLLGFCAAFVSSMMGLLASLHVFLYAKNHEKNLMALLFILIIIPDLVLGVALLILFSTTGFPLGFWSLLIAHITFCLPFVILTLNTRIHTLDANIYFSAIDLGASSFKALYQIMLPMLWPAVLSAFLLAFTLSFDDVIVSYFVSGPEFSILPLTIYALVRAGVTPELNALCSYTLLFSMVLVISSWQLSRSRA